MIKLIHILIFCTPINSLILSQTIQYPNIASKSHPTLTITSIEIGKETKINLRVENKSDKGDWFCADKKILITDFTTGKQYQLKKSENIPTCPDSYRFTFVGQTLDFSLIFPSLPTNTEYINLTEDCSDYCFNFTGIVLNTQLNSLIDNAYNQYSKGNKIESVKTFETIANIYQNYKSGIIYFNIIKIYSELDNWEKVKIWYKKLQESDFNDKQYFLDIVKNNKYYNP